MNTTSLEPLVTQLFKRVRHPFKLGMREYLAALDALGSDLGIHSPDDLRLILELLWCHSLSQQAQFELIWEEITPQDLSPTLNRPSPSSPTPPHPPPSLSSPPPSSTPPLSSPPLEPSQSPIEPLAVQPPLTPIDIEDLPDLQTYWPISRRSMAYAWRYLRRPRLDGPPDVLDIALTIEQAAKTGFFLSPVYRRREINHAHLLLLIDQGGSMTPFHWFSRDLVETTQSETVLSQVDIFYFRNIPSTHVYQDSHLTQPIEIAQMWSQCDADTSVMIFSDAGAARGSQRFDRIRSTTEFLVELQHRTSLLGWLNPMPRDRWSGSSAELISYLVPMTQMDEDGFSNLIEIIRGQPLSSGQNE